VDASKPRRGRRGPSRFVGRGEPRVAPPSALGLLLPFVGRRSSRRRNPTARPPASCIAALERGPRGYPAPDVNGSRATGLPFEGWVSSRQGTLPAVHRPLLGFTPLNHPHRRLLRLGDDEASVSPCHAWKTREGDRRRTIAGPYAPRWYGLCVSLERGEAPRLTGPARGPAGSVPAVASPRCPWSLGEGRANDGGSGFLPTRPRGVVTVLWGLGDGTFSCEQVFSPGILPKSAASVDLDGDRRCDAITADRAGGTVTVLGRCEPFSLVGTGRGSACHVG